MIPQILLKSGNERMNTLLKLQSMELKAKKNPSISVIIPIYNVESYIRECAESLFKQTLNNIEFIFIDDASTDRSVAILNDVISKYPERQSQIKLILHKKNEGISYTRQEGVNEATGEWVIHCDSDDIVEPSAYLEMLNLGLKSKADIVMGNYKRFSSDGRFQEIELGEEELQTLDLLERISGASPKSIHGSLWNKLIKRELYKNAIFPQEVSFAEDVTVLIQILTENPDIKIVNLSRSCYNYRKRDNSLITLNDEKREKEIIVLINFLENLKENYNLQSKKAVNAKIIGLLYRLLHNTKNLRTLSRQYKQYKDLINLNKELKSLKKLFLSAALREQVVISILIRKLNSVGVMILNSRKKLLKRI